MKILDVPQSGSVAGTTSSRNRFGQYRRTRAVPVNTNTIAQQTARNNLTDFAQAWRGLTDEQRSAWSAYSAEHPVTDSLGQSQVLTGFQQYVGVNNLLVGAGLGGLATPPADSAPTIEPYTVDVGTAAGLSITGATDPVDADTAVIIDASPPLSPGRSFNADFRRVKNIAAAGTNELTAADLSAKFGTLVAGQKFFLRFAVVSASGLRSNYFSMEIILT